MRKKSAVKETDSGFVFMNPEGKNILLTHEGPIRDITLPDPFDFTYEISSSAFFGDEDLCSVIIPKGVKVIPKAAFQRCVNLMEVSLPSSLEAIERGAFADCGSLLTSFCRKIS